MKDLAYNVRTKYAGEVKLMIKMIPDPVGMALHRFTETIANVKKGKVELPELQEQLYQLAALLVCDETAIKCTKSMRRNLLRKISFAPIDMFECSIIVGLEIINILVFLSNASLWTDKG